LHLQEINVSYNLNDSLDQALLRADVFLSEGTEHKEGSTVFFELMAPDKSVVISEKRQIGHGEMDSGNLLSQRKLKIPLSGGPMGTEIQTFTAGPFPCLILREPKERGKQAA
jgi:hypothetical protein